MGVIDLWPILSELCEEKPLTYLTGKCVAVDLSGWVVQAQTSPGSSKSKNPHLRNLFFRVARLVQLGVSPIFVIDGEPPALKEATLKARNQRRFGSSNYSNISRARFDKTLRECQDLLTCLGIPCLKSSGEAEALCGLLCLNGIVSGVITEDNDAFLYGADVIYRDFSIEEDDAHVNVYCLKSEKKKLKLTREKLVAFALLLGCDYVKGVPGIGRVKAEKIISELDHEDILQRFKDWKNLTVSELFPVLENDTVKRSSHCSQCGHLGSISQHKKGGCPSCNSEITCYLPNPDNPCNCQWHIIEEEKQKLKTELKICVSIKKNCPDFPNQKVIDEYLNFSYTINHEDLKWTCPNVEDFKNKAYDIFGWTFENSLEKVLPLITAWQQHKLRSKPGDKTNFIYEPVKIIKQHSLREITYYDVEWKVIMENDNSLNFPTENLVTKEYGQLFDTCYQEVVEEYHRIIAEKENE